MSARVTSILRPAAGVQEQAIVTRYNRRADVRLVRGIGDRLIAEDESGLLTPPLFPAETAMVATLLGLILVLVALVAGYQLWLLADAVWRWTQR